MNDKTSNNQGNDSEPLDLFLARQLRDLPRELEPTRDLWPGIERRIADHPQRKKSDWLSSWMPLGIAASLMMAASALTLSVIEFNRSEQRLVTTSDYLNEARVDYLKVRNPMVAKFTQVNSDLAPETLDVLYQNIDILAQARQQIEAQIRENPGDPQLVEMLMSIHEQELELLKQDYLAPSRSM
ncbi:MAG: hypothetical protein KDI36_04650 [Pseudomonadales bacterium]|nr:hypothetical protein [Pseudomonadales bacterium]